MHRAPPGPHPPLSPYDTTKEEGNEQDLTRYRRSERKERFGERFSVVVVVVVVVFVVLLFLLLSRIEIRDTNRPVVVATAVHRVSRRMATRHSRRHTHPPPPPPASPSFEPRPIEIEAEKSTSSILDGGNFEGGRGHDLSVSSVVRCDGRFEFERSALWIRRLILEMEDSLCRRFAISKQRIGLSRSRKKSG